MKLGRILGVQSVRVNDLVLNAVLAMILARTLGADDFGRFVVVGALAAFVALAIAWGGDETIAVDDTVGPEVTRRILVAVVVVPLGFVCAAIGSVTVGAALSYGAVLAVGSAGLAGHTRRPPRTAVGAVAIGTVVILGLLAVLRPTTLTAALLIVIGGTTARSGLLLAGLPIDWRRWEWRIPQWRFRTSLLASAVSGPLLGRQAGVTIGALLAVSADQVGAFGAAYSAATLIGTVTILGISAITLPTFAEAHEHGGPAALAQAWSRNLWVNAALTVPLLGAAVALAPEIARVLYGEEVGAAAAPYLAGLAVVIAAQRVLGGGSNTALLTVLRDGRTLGRSVLIGSVVNLVGAVVLIGRFGMWGAVVASGAAMLTMSVLTLARGRRIAPLRYPLARVAASVAVGAAAAVGVRPLLVRVDTTVLLGVVLVGAVVAAAQVIGHNPVVQAWTLGGLVLATAAVSLRVVPVGILVPLVAAVFVLGTTRRWAIPALFLVAGFLLIELGGPPGAQWTVIARLLLVVLPFLWMIAAPTVTDSVATTARWLLVGLAVFTAVSAVGHYPHRELDRHLTINYAATDGSVRPFGWLDSPNELGMVSALLVVGLAATLRAHARWSSGLGMACAAVALLESGSRASLLGALIGIGAVLAVRASFTTVATIGLGGAGFWALATGPGVSLAGRDLLGADRSGSGDGSAKFRQQTRETLWDRLLQGEWHWRGAGFDDGSHLRPNALTQDLPNIDHSFYYLLAGYGAVLTAAILAVVLTAGAVVATRRPPILPLLLTFVSVAAFEDAVAWHSVLVVLLVAAVALSGVTDVPVARRPALQRAVPEPPQRAGLDEPPAPRASSGARGVASRHG